MDGINFYRLFEIITRVKQTNKRQLLLNEKWPNRLTILTNISNQMNQDFTTLFDKLDGNEEILFTESPEDYLKYLYDADHKSHISYTWDTEFNHIGFIRTSTNTIVLYIPSDALSALEEPTVLIWKSYYDAMGWPENYTTN